MRDPLRQNGSQTGFYYGAQQFSDVDHGANFVPGQARYLDFDLNGTVDLMLQGTDNRFWWSRGLGNGKFGGPEFMIDMDGDYIPGQATEVSINKPEWKENLITG